MAERKPTSASAKKLDPAQSPRAMYGAELRFQRERAGLSQSGLGELLYVGNSLIAKMETGERRVQPDMAEQLDRVLDAGGFFVRNLAAGRATPYREHFADVAELESVALTIKQWEPLLMPGLLQTPGYALAVIRGYDPVAPAEVVKKRQDARLARAHIFQNAERPLFWAIVDEAAVRRPTGGLATMAGQLRYVAAMAREGRIIFQVLPYSAGSHPGMEGALKLMTFEDDSPMAYVQAQETGTLLDDPATITRCTLTYDLLAAAALSPEASLDFIETAAEEYEHGSQRSGGDVA
ncbi:helix-turn-helix transcriptional regulator [Streptomyces sp. NBC_00433]